MKKIFQLLLTVALCAAFTACKDEVGIPDRGPAGNPEKEAVGVYEGTWTVNVNQDNGAVNVDYTAIGTLTLADGGMAYVADVTAKCDAADFQAAGIAFDMTSKATASISIIPPTVLQVPPMVSAMTARYLSSMEALMPRVWQRFISSTSMLLKMIGASL